MIVSWMTTNQCNLNCSHCYQDAGDRRTGELNTEEGMALIGQIARAGTRILIFSGGEPLMRPDIFELVKHAAKCGLRPVFGTNGTLLTKETVTRLKEAGAAAMGVSLDSLSEEKHNRFRGHADAFRLTQEGIANCREAGLPFQLHTTVMDWNREEILGLMDYAVSAGASAHYLFFLIPVGRGVFLERTALEVEEYESTLRGIMEKAADLPIEVKPTCAPQFIRVAEELGVKTRFRRGCLAGLSYCIVSPVGKVRPCAYMTEEAGDVRDRPFDEIWRESGLFETLRSREYGGACGVCAYGDSCGGCRARAGYYHGGDILAEDSYCAYGRGRLALAAEPSGAKATASVRVDVEGGEGCRKSGRTEC